MEKTATPHSSPVFMVRNDSEIKVESYNVIHCKKVK